jgi:hypothetical protein
MKTLVLVAVTVSFILSSAVVAHAGKRLTTGASGLSSNVECTVLNVSETKDITVITKIHNGAGVLLSQSGEVTLGPGVRTFSGHAASDLWCEFLIVSGSTKDVRGSMVIYEGSGNVVATEVAREK